MYTLLLARWLLLGLDHRPLRLGVEHQEQRLLGPE